MPDWIKLYQRLPYPLRVAVASGRGYYLRRWRYGADTEQLVQQALERESWSVAQWQTWQEERLAYILHRAATQVPYYRNHWQQRRRQGDKASWELLSNWPVLQKQTIRQQPQQFVADDCELDKLFCDRTSGTTGTPLPIWLSQATNTGWYALFEARTRRWLGVTMRDRWAIIGGQLIVSGQATRPPYWVWNISLNQLYMSAFHIRPNACLDYLKALGTHRITHIVSYPSSLYALARTAQELGLEAPRLRGIITNSETLYPEWRELIAKVFQCPVLSTYGMAEIALAGSDCQQNHMHLWPESGVPEIFHPTEDIPLEPSSKGRLVITGLFNPDMCFIRYDVGDWGGMYHNDGCACGRNLPQLDHIDGRTGDMIRTPDGRSIFWANNIFFGLNIQELQVIQEKSDYLRLLVVPTETYGPTDEQALITKIHQRLGNSVQVEIEQVSHILRTANGKFRTVISHLHA